ncbi:hypothetical protein B0A55_10919 [Friedmanniomyces simplex]|uniref:Xaa-Pro dipeptidyl-peptidase-like domain-containing protein n=1 Tax=Friedmanniomyces simplex TaxID=329884 RepID=A0A4U0WBW7_9PEZI|nr:hypothetical protein B0A55_10919 [Friedmanniomyces simplex]
MAVEPAYSFTIPSVEDDTTLECRVYHPADLGSTLYRGSKDLKGAIFAHPYAPLGGCYDDPVVLNVTEMLVRMGYVVATFNFRGAGDSHGKTSWTGKGETEDYVSVVGFMLYYVQNLRHTRRDQDALSPIMSADEQNGSTMAPSGARPLPVLLGGYSYGSLVLARLPPVLAIQKRFEEASTGTAAAEIILRARTLAAQTLVTVEHAQQHDSRAPRDRGLMPEDGPSSPTKRSKVSPVTLGGEETDSSERRRSRDSRRSADLVRKSVDIPRRIKAHIRHGSVPQKHHAASAVGKSHPTINTDGSGDGASPLLVPPHYLLISPVILPFTTTISPPGSPIPPLSSRNRSTDSSAGGLFLQHPSLAAFGTKDAFTSSRRLRAWAEKQKGLGVGFDWESVQGAGHFWREEGVMQSLRERVSEWVETLR